MRACLALALVLALIACDIPTEPVTYAPVARSESAGRPNVLLILTDDQDAKALWVSPTVRANIADRGMRFDRAFVTTALCGPSRVSILRGQYSHNTTVDKNDHAFIRTRGTLDQSTVATWLHDAGYTTGWLGKYLNHYGVREGEYSYVPPGWDEWTVIVPEEGTGYYPTRIIEDGAWVTHDGTYSTDFLTERAVEFIHEHADSSWFLVVSYYGPHLPSTPAPRHAGMFADLAGLRPPSFNIPIPITTLNQVPFGPYKIEIMDGQYRNRLATLLSVDEGVGDIFAALDSTGVLDNTLVIYTSDNGFLLGEHAEELKNLPYEEAARVPMLIRGPGVRQGRSDRIVANIDLAPTIADYAGVPVPSFVDGRSIRPVLEARQDGWRTRILLEHMRQANGGIKYYQTAFRSRTRFYGEWSSGERELYDMTSDTFQMTNTAIPGKHGDLSALLSALKVCAGPACRAAEGP